MKVLMTCAGMNIELRPFTDMMPKCLLPINGRSILYHNLDWLQQFDVTEIIISSFYHWSQLKKAVDSYKSKIPIHFHKQQKMLGTAQTLKNMKYKFDDEPFVFLHGDNLYSFDLNKIYNEHCSDNNMISVLSHNTTKDLRHKTVIKFKEDTKAVDKLVVKPNYKTDYKITATSGVFVANPDIFDRIKNKDFQMFDDVLPRCVDKMNIMEMGEGVEFFNTRDYFMKKSNTWTSYECFLS